MADYVPINHDYRMLSVVVSDNDWQLLEELAAMRGTTISTLISRLARKAYAKQVRKEDKEAKRGK